MANYIRFDWAMKRLLRNKANYAVLEGLMYSLLNEKFTIKRFLDSESNQYSENDKFNRVDILAENERGELAIFEIQNTRELNYFHRILYGVSKVITDHIDLGDDYDKVRKVYSINIVYFSLGQAKDYVYHGRTVFQGLHAPYDVLKLSNRQSEVFLVTTLQKARRQTERLATYSLNTICFVSTILTNWLSIILTSGLTSLKQATSRTARRLLAWKMHVNA